MTDENTDLRVLACRQRYGAHFMNGPATGHFVCQHCGLDNTSDTFYERGVSVWRYSNGEINVMAWRSHECIFSKGSVTEQEVQHALSLVGYRADVGE